MKNDLVNMFKDYVKKSVDAGMIVKEDGSYVNVFEELSDKAKPKNDNDSDEASNGSVSDTEEEQKEEVFPKSIEKVLIELRNSGFYELNGLKLGNNLDSDLDYRSSENTNCFTLISYPGEQTEGKLIIEENAIYLKYPENCLYVDYKLVEDESPKRFALKRLVFRCFDDIVLCEIKDNEGKNATITLYSDANPNFGVLIEDGVPTNIDPDITCNVKFKDSSSPYSYFINDEKNIIGGDYEGLTVNANTSCRDKIRWADKEFGKLRLYRALGELVSKRYHDNYLFEGKQKVLSRGRHERITLEGR